MVAVLSNTRLQQYRVRRLLLRFPQQLQPNLVYLDVSMDSESYLLAHNCENKSPQRIVLSEELNQPYAMLQLQHNQNTVVNQLHS